MKNNTDRTPGYLGPDLAIEAHALLTDQHEGEISGVSFEQEDFEQGTTTTIKVLNEQGASAMGKPLGTYITIEAHNLSETDRSQHEPIVTALANALKKVLPFTDDDNSSILVVGLGNERAIPDALGPMAVGRLLATRHLYLHGDPSMTEGLRNLSLIIPGVMGTTGLETAEILMGLVAQLKPDCLLCVDALAAGELSRLHNTIQLTDAGIHPGSGIGNMRKQINHESIGIPVIAIGVPTVVEAGVIANKALLSIQEDLERPGKNNIPCLVTEQRRQEIVSHILEPFGGRLMVTPKDIDEQVDHIAQIIAKAITFCVHPHMQYDEIEYFLH
jgi:spore protease